MADTVLFWCFLVLVVVSLFWFVVVVVVVNLLLIPALLSHGPNKILILSSD